MKNTLIHANVRKDGAINMKAKGRRELGIRPGMAVDITIQGGIAKIRPRGYTCSICENTTDEPLTAFGICSKCNKFIVASIRNGSSNTLEEALNAATIKHNKAPRGRKV